ncbi:MAG: histidine--tRNA ligase, partial [Gammaproteobacteria bacterium]|nr:histidine--tRNA ligase [Gammaproteobacteria bacterium]
GTTEERHVFKEALVVFLNQHKDQLDEDSQRRIETNPLRVLDSKNPNTQSILADAPVLLDFLGEESLAHFESLKAQLDSVGVTYTINPRLVRGLDYYSRTVFEWVTTHLGAQGTVCAGGRFDKLVEMLGGKTTSAVGFAMGVERLIALMQDLETVKPERLPDVYMVLAGEQAERMGISLAESLRDELPEMRLVQNHGGGSFKSQLKRADKSGAAWAMIIGDDEIAEGVAAMKPLRGGEQQVVRLEELPGFFKQQNFNG